MMGIASKYFIGFGLFAAGITGHYSPIGRFIGGSRLFCWSNDIRKMPMRISIVCILGLGLVFSSLGIRPVQLITFAQLANGILLPLLSAYILWLVNKKSVMRSYENTIFSNILCFAIWLTTLVLGTMSIGKVIGWA